MVAFAIFVIAVTGVFPSTSLAAYRPNIVLIVADNFGYSDVGFNGCKEIPTPHLDAIADSGAQALVVPFSVIMNKEISNSFARRGLAQACTK